MFRIVGVAILLTLTVATASSQEAAQQARIDSQIVDNDSVQIIAPDSQGRRDGFDGWHRKCSHPYPQGDWAHAYRTLCY
jgi:hypothetical protein